MYRAGPTIDEVPKRTVGGRGHGEGNRPGGHGLRCTTAALIHARAVDRFLIGTVLHGESRSAMDAVSIATHRTMTITSGRHVHASTGQSGDEPQPPRANENARPPRARHAGIIRHAQCSASDRSRTG